MRPLALALALAAALAAALAGCASDAPPADEPASVAPNSAAFKTRADTVAQQAFDALGGRAAWDEARTIRFDFTVERGGKRRVVAKHLWDRTTGDYRLEWKTAPDSTYVALFDVGGDSRVTPPGQVYLNGQPVEESDEMMEVAHQRFINDTYWLLAPTKLFDRGVERTYVPDSSDADTEVIRLAFGDVGLTPGDRYWLYIDRETGELRQWAFHLESMPDDAPPRVFRWAGYEDHETPGGIVHLATRKEGPGLTIHTEHVRISPTADEALFHDPMPRL